MIGGLGWGEGRNEWKVCGSLVLFAEMGNTGGGKSREDQSDQGVKHEAET